MWKRVLLLVAALALVWLAFFKKAAPVVYNSGIDPSTGRPLGTTANIGATANQAVANQIDATGAAIAKGTTDILGTIFAGWATSLRNDGGVNSPGTGAGDGWFADSDLTDAGAYSDYGAIDSSI